MAVIVPVVTDPLPLILNEPVLKLPPKLGFVSALILVNPPVDTAVMRLLTSSYVNVTPVLNALPAIRAAPTVSWARSFV